MKSLKAYVINRGKTINLLLEKPKSKFTAASFHELRVEIKKLNALFNLLAYCIHDFKRKKTFKPFKLIFRQAGKVRDLQLEEEVIQKYRLKNSPMDILNNLKQQRANERETFFLLVTDKLKAKLKTKFQYITPLIEKIDTEKVKEYLTKWNSNIMNELSNETPKSKELHGLRKRLKMLDYNTKSLILKNQKNASPNHNVLTDLLGNWHDYLLILQHLQNILDSTQINSKEIAELKKVKSKIASTHKILLSKIYVAMRVSGIAKQK